MLQVANKYIKIAPINTLKELKKNTIFFLKKNIILMNQLKKESTKTRNHGKKLEMLVSILLK